MARDKFNNSVSSNKTAVDIAIDRYLETGNPSVLAAFYKPKETAEERIAAMVDLGKRGLENGADPRAWVKAWMNAGLQLPTVGKTPLDYAREQNQPGNEIVKLLLRAGAKINGEDTEGRPSQALPLKL